MAIAPGTRLGSYEVVSLLEVGGMGEVYRARDVRLRRDVAIKTLPETLTADPDRLARFEREARVLASLNHPNIATLFAVEEGAAGYALVMELVDGETLADLLRDKPLSLKEALSLTRN
jgi:serine/threonine protein kinase